MPCRVPYRVKRDNGLMVEVSCGQCLGCRIKRKQAWVGRLLLESAAHFNNRFITLTYKDDPGVLDYEHFQQFLRAYRYQHGRIRYFAVGEYGEKHGRGHWHAILFGSRLPYGNDSLGDCWDRGFSLVGSATVKSMGYVAGYVTKDVVSDCLNRPFIRCSLKPSIGLEQIGTMARCMARDGTELFDWPRQFLFGDRRYPLSTGGLRHFMAEYLKAGGVAPRAISPITQDLRYRASLLDWGSRFRSEHLKKLDRVELGDRHAIRSVAAGSL